VRFLAGCRRPVAPSVRVDVGYSGHLDLGNEGLSLTIKALESTWQWNLEAWVASAVEDARNARRLRAKTQVLVPLESKRD